MRAINAAFEFVQMAKIRRTMMRRRVMNAPYQIIASKKGSFPKGVRMGNSGSRTKDPNLPIKLTHTIPSVKAIVKFRKDKSTGLS